MGYLSIENLYRPEAQKIFEFRKVYALEKIHGTSAHIVWNGVNIGYFSGGEKNSKFRALFDEVKLTEAFKDKFDNLSMVTIFGEAYGGKQQGMSHTYGPDLRFVAFDVKINDRWLDVPSAAALCDNLDIDFVPFTLIDATLDSINIERDLPSVQAVKVGITEPKLREGVVLRPPFECSSNRGRVIAKHKCDPFSEREKPIHREDFDPAGPKAQEMLTAEAIAEEWASPMRLSHVIDHILSTREDKVIDMKDAKTVITEMVADIKKEFDGDVATIDNRVCKAIGSRTATLLRARLAKDLNNAYDSKIGEVVED